MKYIIFFCSLINATASIAQTNSDSIRQRNIIWFTPVRHHTQINGVALGLSTVNQREDKILQVNGLNVELAPLSIISGIIVLPYNIVSLFPEAKDSSNRPKAPITHKNEYDELDSCIGTQINGVSISGGGLVDVRKVKGISLNGLICLANQVHGVECTSLTNFHYSFNGLMIAALRNKCTVGNGVQIGLFNSCKDGNVLQIGLFNRIGKRTIPLINFKVKKNKQHHGSKRRTHL
jgi:hypothetical protein